MGDPKGAAYVLNSPDFQRNYSDRVALEEFVRHSTCLIGGHALLNQGEVWRRRIQCRR